MTSDKFMSMNLLIYSFSRSLLVTLVLKYKRVAEYFVEGFNTDILSYRMSFKSKRINYSCTYYQDSSIHYDQVE